MDTQPEIQWYMRPYLLDFLIEAHGAFGLLPETLFLAVNLLDRYCSKRTVYRRHYQLVGCTALLIASKYVECAKKVPRIRELANMCCSLYDEEMFVQMERHVMVTIEWYVGAPTIDSFLEIALDEGIYYPEVEHMALYLSEMAMFHREFVATPSSEMTKAAITLARIILGKPQPMQKMWSANYGSMTLVALSRHIHRPSQILQNKYRSANTSHVSMIVEDFIAKHTAIAKAAVSIFTNVPLSPTIDSHSPSHQQAFVNPATLRTPQKAPNDCLTPPITPDIESFKGYGANAGKANLPYTPTPNTSYSLPQLGLCTGNSSTVMLGNSIPPSFHYSAVHYTKM